MAAQPDTLVVTGPAFQQVSLDNAIVTPLGGSPAALNTLVGAGGTVVTGGTIAGPVTLTGTLTNSGTIAGGAVAGPVTLSGTLTNSGTIAGGAVAGPVTLTGTLTNSGTIAGGALAGPITFTGTFTNSGTVTGGVITATTLRATGNLFANATSLGFYGTTGIIQQTGVSITAAGIHAACVALGLFTA